MLLRKSTFDLSLSITTNSLPFLFRSFASLSPKLEYPHMTMWFLSLFAVRMFSVDFMFMLVASSIMEAMRNPIMIIFATPSMSRTAKKW